MNVIATIAADPNTSPLGTRSRLMDDLVGRPILRRTVERVLRSEAFSAVHILCTAAHAERLRPLLDGLDVRWAIHGGGGPPYETLVRAGRMWGLDGWRGGVGGLCAFDEDFHAPVIDALLQQHQADSVMSIPAAAPLIDPDLLAALVQHHRENLDSARLTFVQAPPGLAGMVMARDVLGDLTPAGMPPGALWVYQPSNAAPDLTGREACYRPAAAVIEASGRLVCDTRRSLERVERLFAAGGEAWDAARIAAWLNAEERGRVESVPEEIEIELTTGDPLGDGQRLRPRGAAVGDRGPLARGVIDAVAAWTAGWDDIRVVLGGFGEPTRHPEFAAICQTLREAGVAAIAVRTNAVEVSTAAETALFETPIDVIEVTLDAGCAETYAAVNGAVAYDSVLGRLERWIERRTRSARVLPLIVPSMIKAVQTLGDLESFVDKWQSRLGMYLVTGAGHYAGQRSRSAVTDVAPPDRCACRRVCARTLILADGRMTTCDQDFSGVQTIGRVPDESPGELWQAASTLRAIRAGEIAGAPLCATCDEWHRA